MATYLNPYASATQNKYCEAPDTETHTYKYIYGCTETVINRANVHGNTKGKQCQKVP